MSALGDSRDEEARKEAVEEVSNLFPSTLTTFPPCFLSKRRDEKRKPSSFSGGMAQERNSKDLEPAWRAYGLHIVTLFDE